MPPFSCFVRPIAAAGLLALAAGCGGDDDPVVVDACQALSETPLGPAALTSENLPAGTRVGQVETVAHCRVAGMLDSRTGIDGKPYATGFELRLPTAWNGRFLYQGGGGNDGSVRPALGTQGTLEPALNQGYAVVSTDAGHQGTDASFGADPQARLDHAYQSHDRVARAAKTLISAYYERDADHSYFIGCSGGGRQGMMFTQRFPEYFDGVIAIAPAMSVAKGATIAAAWSTQALLDIAPLDASGRPILSQALSDADLGLLRQSILDTCDEHDGLADGLVSAPGLCHYDPGVLQCQAGQATDCLEAGKVEALRQVAAPPRDSQGQALYTDWPWDPGIGHPANDWRAWRLGTSPTADANARHITLMQDALGWEFFTPPQPGFLLADFDFDRDPARMEAFATVYNADQDARLDAFKGHGGKLLLAHGMADPIFSPSESITYFERLQAAHPADADSFARLYLIPGMAHCAGGAATDAWDGLGTLVRWVEQQQAPQEITAYGTAVYPDRSRPLCPYPGYPRYNGQGDPEDAASFTCVAG